MSASSTTIRDHDDRYFRIGQVSRLTQIAPSVLRYWEAEFPMLEPVKSLAGYRMYRQQDVNLVLKIKRLLYEQGFTIAGARRHLQDLLENGLPLVDASDPPAAAAGASVAPQTAPVNRGALLQLRDTLRGFLTLLKPK